MKVFRSEFTSKILACQRRAGQAVAHRSPEHIGPGQVSDLVQDGAVGPADRLLRDGQANREALDRVGAEAARSSAR
jgi:hypothetical protein